MKLDADPLDGASAAIQAVRQQIRAAAASPSTTVLIEGESGTGKQLVARAIHAASIRRAAPYVEVDCTTVAAGLAESELFGHERGAFTGAAQRKLGLIETADGGSLLLDEVGELELAIQAKLLRLLQERTVRRVGGTHDRAVDVRILASTNRTLAREVDEGRFRNDLYYRLRVFVVTMPPLRERGDDVILLANKFVAEFGKALGKPDTRLTPAAVATLRRYGFPGNIRELRAVVEQAVVRAEGSQVDADLLFLPRRDSDPPKSMLRRGRPREVLTPDEAQHIRRVMVAHFGNQSKAAAQLGISRFTLKRKLLQMQEQPADPERAERR
jgi:DNA-binding NtrC family response regulator